MIVHEDPIANHQRMVAQRRSAILGHRDRPGPRRRRLDEPRQRDSPCHCAHIHDIRRRLVARCIAGKGRPVGIRLGLRPLSALGQQLAEGRGVLDVAAAKPSARLGMQANELRQFFPCPTVRTLQDGNQHQSRPDRGRVETRIGVAGPGVRNARWRLRWKDPFPMPSGRPEVARLQGHLPQSHQRLVAPTAGKRLMDHVVQQPVVALGNAFFIPFARNRIDPAAIEFSRLAGQRGQLHLAGLAEADQPRRGHAEKLALGVLQDLSKRFDGLVPLPIRQAGFDPFQMGQDHAVGPVELYRIAQLELAARHQGAQLGPNLSRHTAEGHRQSGGNRRGQTYNCAKGFHHR